MIDLEKRIEKYWLAQQQEIQESLEDLPTADQIIMGIAELHQQLEYDQIEYLGKQMVQRMDELRDRPKVLMDFALEKFSEFLINQCTVELMIILVSYLRRYGIDHRNEKFQNVLNIIGEVTDVQQLGF